MKGADVKTQMTDLSRRRFLKRAATVPAVGAIAPWILNLAAGGEAMAATATDYKALVCVFLYGGNDYANTLVPYDGVSYTAYQTLRQKFAYTQDSLANTVLNPTQVPIDVAGVTHQYALAPELAPLMPMFNGGQMAVLLNVGTLIQPTTKAEYLAGSVPLPSKLFSHNDQQSEWQSSGPEGTTTGWGGRMEDLLEVGNVYPTFSAINVYANAVFLSGATATQYQVTSTGSVPLTAQSSLYGSAAAAKALQSVISAGSSQLFESDYAAIVTEALNANQVLTSALALAPTINTVFPNNNSLADQLKMVARIASVAKALGAKRQVFFVALGGFDTHDTLATDHPTLLTEVGGALAAFYNATVELGLASNVTTFSASEFGRTLTVNNDGSDHGWGSMHFVLGGAVNGRRYYGTPPVVADNGPDDVGQGRLLPTTAVDQYAATLGKWFGISDGELLSVLPNLANFSSGSQNLGFI
jgi:uncharacterized protein (DUF1501 family)